MDLIAEMAKYQVALEPQLDGRVLVKLQSLSLSGPYTHAFITSAVARLAATYSGYMPRADCNN